MSALADDAPRGFVPMRDYLKLQRRVDELEAQLADRKQDEREEADEALVDILRRRLRLSPQEARVTIMLAQTHRPLMRLELLHEAIGCPEINQIRILAHKANKRMAALGAPLHMMRGQRGRDSSGWWMIDEGRAWLLQRVPELSPQGASR